jgi:hypothetical protein
VQAVGHKGVADMMVGNKGVADMMVPLAMVARLATGREHKVVADVVAAAKPIVGISKGSQAGGNSIHRYHPPPTPSTTNIRQHPPTTSINNIQQRSEELSAEES